MAQNKTTEWLQNRRQQIDDAAYSDDCSTAILTLLDAYNPDYLAIKPPRKPNSNGREDSLATSSRLAYASTLHNTAQQHDLLEATASTLNRYASRRLSGEAPDVKDGGVSQNTVHQNQIAWRTFYRFHQRHPEGAAVDVDPDDIVLVDRDEASVDERDMFDSDEIRALREACPNKRDRAVLELLIFTGQRHNALRQLTYKDIKPEEGASGKLYIPDDVEGMKGAEGKRPLLGAQKACREWQRSHPTQEPDDAFITHVYDWSGHDSIEAGDHLSRQSFGKIPKRIADKADVDKPAHPHNFRHYFVTQAVANHGMSMDTVRHLIGHNADSRELERTYQHLVDEDHIENAELDMDLRDGREESLTPSVCTVCDEPLEPSWSTCPVCGTVYGPNATNIEAELETATAESALAATDEQEKESLRVVMDVLEDEETVDQLRALVDRLDADSLEEAASQLSK